MQDGSVNIKERKQVLQVLEQLFPSSLWREPCQSREKVGEETSGRKKPLCTDPFVLTHSPIQLGQASRQVRSEAELGR